MTSIKSTLSHAQIFHSLVQILRRKSRSKLLMTQVAVHDPDLVHALRLPYEGITALMAIRDRPVIVSSWGQDFTPQSDRDPLLRHWYKTLLPRVSGLMSDDQEDLDRARNFRLKDSVPTLIAAGNFGVNTSLFYPEARSGQPVVLYPRRMTPNNNFRGFIKAAAALSESSDALFIGVGLSALSSEVASLVPHRSKSAIELTPDLSQFNLAAYMRRSAVVVSPAYSDGMPNSVLEALSCGARVVAGDLPQLAALKNLGLPIELVDARDARSIADGIERALASGSFPLDVRLPAEYSVAHNEKAVYAFYEAILS
ncbi:glycosyltransferase family 4 protein [Frigoribacterium faeni]|uniref:glycosyltransferase family 4 protein n=1 Tax=Frigoribacterium faeni TaxID=145483 RepID=UPI0024130BC5|nr:glycosyltransferase family 4 protein [Frigoribacterium faeni]